MSERPERDGERPGVDGGRLQPQPAARVESAERDGVRVVTVRGEVDLSNVAELREAAFGLPHDALGVVLDLTGASFIDSATLSLIFELQHSFARRCQAFRIACAPGSNPRRVLELAALDRQAPCDEDCEQALAAILADARAAADGAPAPDGPGA